MLSRPGPGSHGYNFQTEFIDFDCMLQVNAGVTVPRGATVCRDVTAISDSSGADHCLLPNHAAAGPPYGVYQGAPFTNHSTVVVNYPIVVRAIGYGVVLAAAPTIAVIVGGNLGISGNGEFPEQEATVPSNGNYIGVPLATGIVTTKNGILIPIAGPNALVNCDIFVQ